MRRWEISERAESIEVPHHVNHVWSREHGDVAVRRRHCVGEDFGAAGRSSLSAWYGDRGGRANALVHVQTEIPERPL